jgi:hypothetical protein
VRTISSNITVSGPICITILTVNDNQLLFAMETQRGNFKIRDWVCYKTLPKASHSLKSTRRACSMSVWDNCWRGGDKTNVSVFSITSKEHSHFTFWTTMTVNSCKLAECKHVYQILWHHKRVERCNCLTGISSYWRCSNIFFVTPLLCVIEYIHSIPP